MGTENRHKYLFGVPPPPGCNSENIVLESATVIHGENCFKNGCKFCTPKSEVDKLGEERLLQYRESHKGKYVGVRGRRARKQQLSAPEADIVAPDTGTPPVDTTAAELDPKYSEEFDT